MISLDKCIGSCNVLSQKICVSEPFHMITNKNEAKTTEKHVSCDYKCKFNSTTCNSNQKWSNENCQCKCKNYRKCKKDYSCICENSKYLIADTSVKDCDEFISIVDIVSTKMTNTISTNVSISCHNKK